MHLNGDAVVLEVDPQNSRISLGLKQASEDPWSSIASQYEVGQVVTGKVSKIASFSFAIRCLTLAVLFPLRMATPNTTTPPAAMPVVMKARSDHLPICLLVRMQRSDSQCGTLDALANSRVGTTTADIAGHGLVNVGIGW